MSGDGIGAESDLIPKQRRISPEAMELALRLADVVQKMRAEALFNLETFLVAAEKGVGGSITVTAPRKSGKRSVPEARYTGECGTELSIS